ncbi:dynactin subunit 2-like isoform X3 [Corticium candelabrum]|uniref:dynactin subunit 2-like isoform X3 n=1 Tax=Corticium candelabrum TaxID=121492 RepID=UPI002E2697AF|nr:dynactin subunit 2-like isoform X3 [Corticium candelabrum]
MSSLFSQETQESEKTITSVVSSLEEKAALLDLNEIDQIEARLQSVLYHMNQISEQKPAVESAAQQSKVNELFEVVKRWDAIASLLPDLVARLEALQHLHSQAADFSQNITHLDAAQQKIKEELETNSSLLSEVKSSFHTNADAIAANCENLEQRIAALFAKLEKS